MEKFTQLSGVAAPLLKANIDTDTIAPGSRPATAGRPRQFAEKGTDLKKNLFAAWRYDADDNELPDFILNQPPFRDARFLLTGPNFGCGSSRESACWMLKDFGIRCVIAPSFGEIFYDNCFKNSMLPVILPQSLVEELVQETGNGTFTVNLEEKHLVAPSGRTIEFSLPDFLRQRLLQGLEEIEMTLGLTEDISRFQREDRINRPWVYPS